jgi:adenosylcobinamide-GDP ribazoletransferase
VSFLKPLWVSIGFYSILPAPRAEWTEKNMSAAICFMPAVGVVIGVLLWAWTLLCGALPVNDLLYAAVAALIPVIVTGGIHLDGFMDTADALASRQTRERKLEIMKDPRVGAFAVIWCAVYLLLCLALYGSVDGAAVPVVCAGFALSRALCSLSALTLPSARGGGLLCAFTEHSRTAAARLATGALSVACAAGMIFFNVKAGSCAAAAALAVFLVYRSMAKKQFGGATGDTCGFFIQVCELCVLFGAAAGGFL